MRFIFGFFVGLLTGMFCILGPFAAFIAGIVVTSKALGNESDESETSGIVDEVLKGGMRYPKFDTPTAEETPTP